MRKMGRGRCVCETDTERAFCLLRRGDGGLQRGGRSAFFRPAVCMIFRGRTEEMIRVRDDDTTVVGFTASAGHCLAFSSLLPSLLLAFPVNTLQARLWVLVFRMLLAALATMYWQLFASRKHSLRHHQHPTSPNAATGSVPQTARPSPSKKFGLKIHPSLRFHRRSTTCTAE